MNSRDVLPKNVAGVGGSYRSGVGNAGVGWVGHAGVGWSGLGHATVGWVMQVGVGWVMQGWCWSCRGGWDGVGHAGLVRQGLGGVNLEMPQGIKSDRTIMEVQGISDTKILKYESIKLLVLQGI